MKAYELIADKSAWTQGAFGRDSEGWQVHERHPSACSWCLLGAIGRSYDGQAQDEAIVKVSMAIHDTRMSIARYNDDPARTHEEVYNLLKELDV